MSGDEMRVGQVGYHNGGHDDGLEQRDLVGYRESSELLDPLREPDQLPHEQTCSHAQNIEIHNITNQS